MIAEIETDKATMEVEAVDEGTLGKILVPEGAEGVEGQHADRAAAGRGRGRRGDRPAGCPGPSQRRSRQRSPEPEAEPAPVARPVCGDGAAPAARAPQRGGDPGRHDDGAQTVREALRDAMAEEMRRDADVFLMGEEVAEYQGAYKVSQGLLEEFGARRVIDTPITEHGFAGLGVGAAFGGPEADRRVHDLELRHAGDRPHHQLGGKDALHVGRRRSAARSCSAARTAPPRGSAPSTARNTLLVRALPGLKVVAPYSAADAKGLLKAAIRDPNPVIFLENEMLYGHSFEVPQVDDFVLPIGRREGRCATAATSPSSRSR